MKGLIKNVFTICFIFLATSCVGIRYDKVEVPLSYTGSDQVVVAALDQRPYVLSGDKSPEFIALVRSSFGIPYSYDTDSGETLAADLMKVLDNSFKKAGFNVKLHKTDHNMTKASLLRALKASPGQKKVLLLFREWKSDTYSNSWFKYNAELTVLGASGQTLAHELISGEDRVDGSVWNPAAAATKAVPKKSQEILGKLLNRPAVRRALAY